MKKLLFLVIAGGLLLSCSSGAKLKDTDQRYDLTYFVDERIESVVRDYSTEITVSEDRTAEMKVYKAVTIMKPEAKDLGEVVIYYSDFEKVSGLSGRVYDMAGNEVYALSGDDIIDASATSNISIAEDTRVKYFELTHYRYPYTIVYEYTKSLKSLLNIPSWYIQNPNEYVEKAYLKVDHPVSEQIKSWESNFEGTYRDTVYEDRAVKTWSVAELSYPELESYSEPYSEQVPRVLLASEEFRVDNSSGSTKSWKAFGQWYHELSEGRDELSEQTKAEVDGLLKGVESSREKVRLLYDHMQKDTRYISIQLGIGGWQTFPARFVEDTGYGDCKALTNYMFALLKYAGIRSYPVLIRNGTGDAPIIREFPSSQFNHVVLNVPVEGEEIWLECTSQKMPFGYLGTSNSDRWALKISDQGSELIRTPDYDHTTHRLENAYQIVLGENGGADIEVQTFRSGYYFDRVLGQLSGQPESVQKEWLIDQLSLNTFDVTSFDFSDLEQKKVPVQLSYAIKVPSYAGQTGKRLFIPVNAFNRWTGSMREDSTRTDPVYFPFAFTQKDQFELVLPSGYTVESLPDPIQEEHDFGSFRMAAESQDGKIVIEREMQLKKEKVPAASYAQLRTFLNTIYYADRKNLVLVRDRDS